MSFLLILLRNGQRPSIQSLKMPRPTKSSACVTNTSFFPRKFDDFTQESSSSDVEMNMKSPQYLQPSTSQPQSFVQSMFIFYIEGPKMGKSAKIFCAVNVYVLY